MEEWKEIRSVNTAIFTNIKWYLSNKGRVKLIAYYKGYQLDEEILSLGHCMYIHKEELHVYMLGGAIYRTIYRLFANDIPKGYQIHHKDYNHYNNDVDNLECLTANEHGKRHDIYSEMFITNTNKVKEINLKYAYYTKEDAANDLKSIYNRFDDKHREYSKKLLEEQKENKKKKQIERRQQYIEERLSTGNYRYENGKLIPISKPKWSEERRKKTEETRKTSEAWKNRNDKIRDTLVEYYSQPENREKQLQQLASIREIRLNKLK